MRCLTTVKAKLTKQIKDGPLGDLVVWLCQCLCSYVPYFPDLLRDARKRKVGGGVRGTPSMSLFMVIHLTNYHSLAFPATHQFPQASLPIAWRRLNWTAQCILKLKFWFLMHISLIPAINVDNHVYHNIHLKLAMWRLLVNHSTWDWEHIFLRKWH